MPLYHVIVLLYYHVMSSIKIESSAIPYPITEYLVDKLRRQIIDIGGTINFFYSREVNHPIKLAKKNAFYKFFRKCFN